MAQARPGILTRIAVVALAALLASCFGGKPVAPPAAPPPSASRLKATIDVADSVNPDARGRPSPIVVKVYELKAPTTFNGADFFSLFERDRETLGGDLVAVEEIQLLPGEKRAYERVLQAGTRNFGVLAAFRAVETAQWRATLPIEANRSNRVLIKLEGTRCTISVVPDPSN